MGPAALVLAWLASLAPLILEREGALDLSDSGAGAAPRLALCTLAWIAVAGLPRATLGPRDLRAWWGGLMACVPVLALALALDVERGSSWPRCAKAIAWALAFIALSALAAELARARLVSSRVHAALWIALVPGLPLLQAALSFGSHSADSLAPEWSRSAAQCSPLHWALAAVDGSPSPYGPGILLIGLCLAAALTNRGASA